MLVGFGARGPEKGAGPSSVIYVALLWDYGVKDEAVPRRAAQSTQQEGVAAVQKNLFR